MTVDQVRSAYLNFFKSKNHAIIPPAPLVPQDDPTTLFNGSGMQQLVPFLKGKPHPMGKRLVDSQPCFRAEDINEVGDNRHTTYFEMLGNWSLGDYFKKQQLSWIWEFLTKSLKLPQSKLYVSVFKGNKQVKKDTQSIEILKKLGIKKDKIFEYGDTKNWWSRAGTPSQMPSGEIGGTTSEVFYEFTDIKHNPKYGKTCHPNCDCGRFLEIANSVFMEYEKQKDGSLKPLPKQNVDFGGGLERLVAAVLDTPDVFKIDVFAKTIKKIEKITNKKYSDDNQAPMRIIADHLRAANAMLDQNLTPSNKQQGYVLRRLIRRSALKLRQLKGELNPQDFKQLINNSELIDEITRFQKSLDKGLRLIEKTPVKQINAQFAFNLFQTHGFPFEITQELLQKKGVKLTQKDFDSQLAKHQNLSRTASTGMFKGGLEDQSEIVTRLHTATHLLHASLRKVLGDHVKQQGSNITSKRLRFDFSHDKPITDKQIQKIQTLINQQIKKDLPVKQTTMPKQKALKSGALAFFKQTYPDKVSVYSIGNFSKELCGGPHVSSTSQISPIKIFKTQSIGRGLMRLYARSA